jgi:hypothetical protein
MVARSVSGDIQWQFWNEGSPWSAWYTLEAPSVGAASAPVITTNARNHLEVFVRGGDARLYRRIFDGSWTPNWERLGNEAFAGKPAIALRVDGTLETVVATVDGGLRHETFIDGLSVASQSIDGPIAANTSPALAVSADELHLFITSSSHHLAERVLTGAGWSPWRDLGGMLTSSPSVAGSLARRELTVAASIEESGTPGMWVRSWPVPQPCHVELTCGACAESCVGGSCEAPARLGGAPTHYRRLDGSDALMVRAADGHLYYFVRRLDEWFVSDLYARGTGPVGLATGEASASARPDGVETVFYRTIDNQVAALTSRGDGWEFYPLSDFAKGSDTKGDPVGYVRADGSQDVVYRGIDDHVWVLYLPKDDTWYSYDFTGGSLQAPSARSDLYPFIRADDDSAVVYVGGDGQVHELYLVGSNWQWTSMVPPNGEEPLGDPTAYVRADQRNAIVYRSADGGIHEWSADWNSHSWTQHEDVSVVTGAPSSDVDPTAYVGGDGRDAIVYRSNEDIYQLRRDASGWVVIDLTEAAGAPGAESSPTPFVDSDGASAVAYVAVDGRLVELSSEDGEDWTWSVIFDHAWQ